MGKYGIVVIGTSAGGLTALEEILTNLDKDIPVPIVIVQHLGSDSGDSIYKLLRKYSTITMKEPIDKEILLRNRVYIAPAGYHLMIELIMF